MDFLGVNYDNASAVDVIKAILKPYGLDGLAQGMYDVGKTSGDSNVAYIWLRDQKQYKDAFPGMAIREKNGYSPIDENTYMTYKTAMKSVMANNGIPGNFYDGEDDFANFIGNNISPQEVEDRVTKGVLAAKNAPQAVKDALFQYYGIDDGHLAAYWLDPSPERGAKLLQEQAATYVGAAGMQSGYKLSKEEAERLQKSGVQDVSEKLGTLGQSQELFSTLASEAQSDITREEQLQYAEGSGTAQQKLAKKAAQRKAEFQGGGSYAGGEGGVSGLGVAK